MLCAVCFVPGCCVLSWLFVVCCEFPLLFFVFCLFVCGPAFFIKKKQKKTDEKGFPYTKTFALLQVTEIVSSAHNLNPPPLKKKYRSVEGRVTRVSTSTCTTSLNITSTG